MTCPSVRSKMSSNKCSTSGAGWSSEMRKVRRSECEASLQGGNSSGAGVGWRPGDRQKHSQSIGRLEGKAN